MKNLILILCLSAMIFSGSLYAEQSIYSPGISLNGINLNNGALDGGLSNETCAPDPVQGEIIAGYTLTHRIYIYRTHTGYGVADLSLSDKDYETGVRRLNLRANNSCKITTGLQISGKLQCKGKKMVQKVPYEQCAYDMIVWGHGLSEIDAMKLAIQKLQEQFLEYKQENNLQ